MYFFSKIRNCFAFKAIFFNYCNLYRAKNRNLCMSKVKLEDLKITYNKYVAA